ncbi:sensor histidine kinase [Kitasatospora herbaricolor]|uniref:histidine kinase n=1 Tax=Kitasatospora herbaricolor TaxID=68217 RepID=A0ABZ1WH01_9ACTN|nr:ATP-binding protein [Kitasatospora herbaricolor]
MSRRTVRRSARRALPPWRRPASIRVRITLLTTLAVALPLALGVVAAADALRPLLLQNSSEYLSATVAGERPDGGDDPERNLRRLADELTDNPRLEARLHLTTGPGPAGDNADPDLGNLSLWPWTDPARARPVIQKTLTVDRPDGSTLVLQVASRLQHEQYLLNTVLLATTAGMALLTALVTALTWAVAGRVLSPVESIRRRFAELTAHDLGHRVPVPGTRDEVARLARTMNATLDRLQSAVEQQRRFVADASHELRSPLAALRAELEIALARPDLADWPEVVRGALGDTERLQHLVTDLLLLARLDAQDTSRRPAAPVDLGDLVREEAARRRPPAHLILTVRTAPGPVLVDGHRAPLTRVLGNLLDNAERYAAATVSVGLAFDDRRREAVLEVRDDGPGIPPEDRARVFERFTRLDEARTRDSGGAGLGLAIARHIAALHHGTLEVAACPDGALLRARLPASNAGP